VGVVEKARVVVCLARAVVVRLQANMLGALVMLFWLWITCCCWLVVRNNACELPKVRGCHSGIRELGAACVPRRVLNFT
jgi:hypothetical protein